jgi:ATP-binding protein involved in chromosome partitioning
VATGAGRPAATPATGIAQDLPCAIDLDVTGLEVLWADGETQIIPARDLRIACPCAACRDEVTGARLLDPEAVALTVAPTRIWSVGNYALGIAFSDGHSSGIYTFQALRRMQGAETEDV